MIVRFSRRAHGAMLPSTALVPMLALACVATGCSPSEPARSSRKTDAPITAKGTQQGEKAEVANWFTKSPELDGVEGTEADRAYAELNLGSGSEIVVAVIDSGVDITHEDLQGRIWVNEDEIPGNRIDDDGNGYVDDIHGWNFLGNTDAEGNAVNLEPTTLEMTRELVRMKKLKQQAESEGGSLTAEQEAYLAKVSEAVEAERSDATEMVATNTATKEAIEVPFAVIKDALGIELKDLTVENTEKFAPADDAQKAAREEILRIFAEKKVTTMARVLRRIEYYTNTLETYLNESFDPRAEIIKDDPFDLDDRDYGNNDVKGPDSSHGTHVAGIIGAVRGNGIGIDGIADNVKIMAIRTVPDGDEYDKDVALSVRYAVDNGARVINMSFGKAFSPLKGAVDEAFRYAADRGVILVHAAGNSNHDNDTGGNYPNAFVADSLDDRIGNWLEVGASSKDLGSKLPATFSNYGARTVDLFAPGVDITSTVPDTNQYDTYSGTSMASPAAAGVVALVWSRHPELSASEIRELVLGNVRAHRELPVFLPGTFDLEKPTEVLFGTLSVTGGIANAFNALKAVAGLK